MEFGGTHFCVFVFFVMLHTGESLKCFQCSSSPGGDCDHPLNTTTVTVQECSGGHDACLLLNVTNNGVTHISRECAYENYCSRSKRQSIISFSRSCSTCSWNLCNSVPYTAPSLMFVLTGAFIAAKQLIL